MLIAQYLDESSQTILDIYIEWEPRKSCFPQNVSDDEQTANCRQSYSLFYFKTLALPGRFPMGVTHLRDSSNIKFKNQNKCFKSYFVMQIRGNLQKKFRVSNKHTVLSSCVTLKFRTWSVRWHDGFHRIFTARFSPIYSTCGGALTMQSNY